MSRRCALTGKKPVFGRSIQYNHGGNWARRAPKTNRIFKPNVHRHRVYVPELGEWVTLHLSTQALRTISRKGLLKALKDEGRSLEDVKDIKRIG
jgi:large subunit ribosomal protein L28